MDGLRKTFAKDFSKIYCFNLKGNSRDITQAKKQGGNIFDVRVGVAISILIKNPNHQGNCQIYYAEIPDFLNKKEKFAFLTENKSFKNLKWQKIIPNSKGDWFNQRNDFTYESLNFISLGDKDKKNKSTLTIFNNYSLGVNTARDAWCYNFSTKALRTNMQNTIDFYNEEVKRFISFNKEFRINISNFSKNDQSKYVNDFVNSDPMKISWARSSKQDLLREKSFLLTNKNIVKSSYRPFCIQKLYFSKDFNDMTYQLPKIFPKPELKNIAIGITGKGVKQFSCFIVNLLPNYSLIGSQWFPLYTYEETSLSGKEATNYTFGYSTANNLSSNSQTEKSYTKKDNISDAMLQKYQIIYNDNSIKKEDIFYYIYGLLHSKDYVEKYFEYITKEIPKIPFVKTQKDFIAFKEVGESLAKLHLDYENVPPLAQLDIQIKNNSLLDKDLYYVKKMKFNKDDTSTIIYNDYITIGNIPKEAYDYEVNAKSAIKWLMDSYQIKIDEASQLENNPNHYSEDPKYIFNLLCSVINVSVKSVEIINNVPPLVIKEDIS